MTTFELEPGAEVSGVGDGGEVLSFTFDASGQVKVADDFQEAHRLLLGAGAKVRKTPKAKE